MKAPLTLGLATATLIHVGYGAALAQASHASADTRKSVSLLFRGIRTIIDYTWDPPLREVNKSTGKFEKIISVDLTNQTIAFDNLPPWTKHEGGCLLTISNTSVRWDCGRAEHLTISRVTGTYHEVTIMRDDEIEEISKTNADGMCYQLPANKT